MTHDKNDELTPCPIDNDLLAQSIWDDSALLQAMTLIENDQDKIIEPSVVYLDSYKKTIVAGSQANKTEQPPNVEEDTPKKHGLTKWPIGIAASIMFAVLVTMLLPSNELNSIVKVPNSVVYSHKTAVGQLANATLEDGTTLNLNANTQLQVVMADAKRRVLFEQGEAFFKVASDKNRPFFVETRLGQVEVVGTEFNVDQTQQSVEIKVYEGKVKVHGKNGREYYLLPGEGLTVDNLGITKLTHFTLGLEKDWQQGTLNFTNKPLNYVVEKLNRYLPHKVYLAPSLNNKKITGTFMLSDVENTLTLLSQLYGLELLQANDGRYLVPKV